MSTPVLPSIIRGPAIIIHNSYSYYTAGDIRVRHDRQTEATPSDMWGDLGGTLSSHKTTLSFTPVGAIESIAKHYPYGPSNLVATSSIGASVMNGTTVIHTKAGQTITYHRSGITQCPKLMMSPRKTLFDAMEITCIGAAATQPTDAAFLKTIGSAAFSDTSFNRALVIKDIYTATLGSRLSPYDAIGAREGFEFDLGLQVEEVKDDNVGIADILVVDIKPQLSFAPNNLTEAQLDALLNLQGTDALLVGQYVGRGPSGTPEDLVVDSDAFTLTLHNAGAITSENGYGVKVDRNGNVTFESMASFATGAPEARFSLVVN